MSQLKSRPQIRQELVQLTGPLANLIYEEGPIDPLCWEFAQDRLSQGHRGVEQAPIHPQRMIRQGRNLRLRSIEAGEW